MTIRARQVRRLVRAASDLVIAQDGARRLQATAQRAAGDLHALTVKSTPEELEAARQAGRQRGPGR